MREAIAACLLISLAPGSVLAQPARSAPGTVVVSSPDGSLVATFAPDEPDGFGRWQYRA